MMEKSAIIVKPDGVQRGLIGEIKWRMQRFSLRKTNGIITDSESSKKDIKKYVGLSDGRISVVHLAAGEEFKVIKIGRAHV